MKNKKTKKGKRKYEKNGKELKDRERKVKANYDERGSNVGGKRVATEEEEDHEDKNTFGFPILDAPPILGT